MEKKPSPICDVKVHAKLRVSPVLFCWTSTGRKNGFEAMQAMKADPQLRSLPVIILTMIDRDEDIFGSYIAGACSCICKSVDLDQFHTVINQVECYWARISKIPIHTDQFTK